VASPAGPRTERQEDRAMSDPRDSFRVARSKIGKRNASSSAQRGLEEASVRVTFHRSGSERINNITTYTRPAARHLGAGRARAEVRSWAQHPRAPGTTDNPCVTRCAIVSGAERSDSYPDRHKGPRRGGAATWHATAATASCRDISRHRVAILLAYVTRDRPARQGVDSR